ncbi:MAG: PAS domain S-box protein [Actinomycetota bacterium]|nr:PAS domain S-box protein [Actinomycetota bacterium]
MDKPAQEPKAVGEIDLFFDLSLDLLVIAGLDGYFKRLNPAWTELLGYSVEELTSRPFNDFVHPDDRDKTADVVGDLKSGAVTYTFENRYRCKDGSYRWLMWNSKPQVETGLIYAVAHNVTEQKKAGESSAKLAAIVQSSNDAIFAWSSDGILTSWNPGAERIYGYGAEEMVGRPVTAALQPLMPPDRPHEFENLLKGLEGGEDVSNFETVRIHRDGHSLDVSLTMSMLKDNGVTVGGSAIVRNESDRKAAQRDRDAHNVMLQAVIANSQSAISVKDLEGRYMLANPSFERAFAVRQEDLLSKTDDVLDPGLAPVWRANDLRAQQGAYHLDEWSDGKDGRQYYESVKFPLHDARGVLYATCGISLDVTERRRAAAAMTEARDAALAATAAKSSFLATMSHEIRTPMNAVIGMTGLLLDTSLDDEQRDFVETVRDSGEGLLTIINDVLDFSKIEAGQLELERESFDLRACVEGALDLLAPTTVAKGIGLVGYVQENLHRVVGDVTRLRQVLINLLGNAIKFTEQGDVMVTVTSDNQNDSKISLRVAVTDSGIGIPADRIDGLFGSFTQVDASTTRKHGGTGLGLAISQRLVIAMGGEITAESELGLGSTFTFSVTMGRDRRHTAAEPRGSSLNGLPALLLSPSSVRRRGLRLQLEAWGMRCSEADTVEGALTAIGNGTGLALAVLDVDDVEPDGRSPLVGRIRQLPAGRNLGLISLCGPGARPVSGGDPRTASLIKPVKRSALRAAVESALGTDPLGVNAPDHPAPEDRVRAPRALRVLLAEDNPVNQKVGKLMLRKLGHRVDIVGDGREAIDAAQGGGYDVILMDVQMPEVDGLEATRAIRSKLPEGAQPRIVAMTASVLVEDKTACSAAGMDDYLAKPVRIESLAAALDSV